MRALAAFWQKTAFNDIAKFQGRKKHGDPLLNMRLPNKYRRRLHEIPGQLKTSYSIKHAQNFAVQLIGKSTD
jgi:hypothetical protein